MHSCKHGVGVMIDAGLVDGDTVRGEDIVRDAAKVWPRRKRSVRLAFLVGERHIGWEARQLRRGRRAKA